MSLKLNRLFGMTEFFPSCSIVLADDSFFIRQTRTPDIALIQSWAEFLRSQLLADSSYVLSWYYVTDGQPSLVLPCLRDFGLRPIRVFTSPFTECRFLRFDLVTPIARSWLTDVRVRHRLHPDFPDCCILTLLQQLCDEGVLLDPSAVYSASTALVNSLNF